MEVLVRSMLTFLPNQSSIFPGVLKAEVRSERSQQEKEVFRGRDDKDKALAFLEASQESCCIAGAHVNSNGHTQVCG